MGTYEQKSFYNGNLIQGRLSEKLSFGMGKLINFSIN